MKERESIKKLEAEVDRLTLRKTLAEIRRSLQVMAKESQSVEHMIGTLLINVRAMEELIPKPKE